MGLRDFFVAKGAENLSAQRKKVNDPKMPETLVNPKFRLIRGRSFDRSRFEAIFASVFV